MSPTAEDRAFLTSVGSLIRRRRQQRGYSQEILAVESELSPRFVSELENGRGNISILRLRQVARALGCPLTELLGEPESMRLVSLIGLRGAGKSAVGARLAARLDCEFIELDERIEREAGLSLAELFALHGESYYRRLELDALSAFIGRDSEAVLASGGGLVTRRATFDLLKRSTTTVWLQAEPQEHLNRVIAQGDSRPMAGRANPLAELQSLLAARTPLYQEADYVVETSGLSVDAVAGRIADYLAKPSSRAAGLASSDNDRQSGIGRR